MKKIIVFIPYFGKLPNNFLAWEISALANSTIDFYFFTDINMEEKSNIKVINISFEDFKAKISKCVGFKIECETPYELCDIKPCYGEVFSEYTLGYDFWGYCDIDLMFGDIRSFITDEMLEKYDRFFINGHFSLYRNISRMNELYRSEGSHPEYNYKDAFSTNDQYYFDEFRGMELKCYRNNIKLFQNEEMYIDISPKLSHFEYEEKRCVYLYKDGHLYVRGNDFDKEILYVHFQKRRIDCKLTKSDRNFVLYPNVIVPLIDNNLDDLYKKDLGKMYKFVFVFKKAKKALKRYGIRKLIARNKRKKEIEKYKRELLDRKNSVD